MNRLKYILLGATIMGLLLALSSFTGLSATLAGEMRPLLAQIVNTSDNPVPVVQQGSTNISGEVTAKQGGEWNVGISPLANTVNVANLPSATTLRYGHGVIYPPNTGYPRFYEIPVGVVVTDVLASGVFCDPTCMFYLYALPPGDDFSGLNNLTALGVFVAGVESHELHFTSGLRSTNELRIGFYMMQATGQVAITWVGYED